MERFKINELGPRTYLRSLLGPWLTHVHMAVWLTYVHMAVWLTYVLVWVLALHMLTWRPKARLLDHLNVHSFYFSTWLPRLVVGPRHPRLGLLEDCGLDAKTMESSSFSLVVFLSRQLYLDQVWREAMLTLHPCLCLHDMLPKNIIPASYRWQEGWYQLFVELRRAHHLSNMLLGLQYYGVYLTYRICSSSHHHTTPHLSQHINPKCSRSLIATLSNFELAWVFYSSSPVISSHWNWCRTALFGAVLGLWKHWNFGKKERK